MSRHLTLTTGLICAMLLAGCSGSSQGQGQNQGDVTVGATVFQNLRNSLGPKPAPVGAAALRPQITPELLAQISGSVILIENRGRGALMAEDGRNGAMVSYVDSGRIGLSLVDGVVVATRGLGNDLMTADVDDVLAKLRPGGQATRIHRRMTGENGIAVTSFECLLSRQGATVTEACFGPSAEFENSYVLDGAGRVAASRQWLGPEAGHVTIERIR